MNRIINGPEAAGFVILGATVGAVLATFAHSGLIFAWAGGTVGAMLLPVGVALPWAGAVRRMAQFSRPARSRTA